MGGGELVATRVELSKNRRDVGQLAQANVRLQNQAIQYKAAAVADERNRVAREIHDSLGHVLTGVSVKLQTVEYLIRKDPAKASEEIAHLHTMVQMALRETRSVVFGLREPGHEILHGRDLWIHLCEVFTNCTGVKFEIDIPEEFNDVDDVTNAIVYRFIQEGITNAYRHGEASLIGVAVWERDSMFRARVSDNGHGTKVVREGFGLTGIRERVNEINGYMEWYSESGKGFDILIVFPMQGGGGEEIVKLRLMIVDDHTVVVDGFKTLIELRTNNMEVVGTAYTGGEEALDKVGKLDPDLILMDLHLPGGQSGAEITRAIKERYPDIKVLILTSYDEQSLVVDAMKAGANGYILKDIGWSELENAIYTVYQGGVLMTKEVANALVDKLDSNTGKKRIRDSAEDGLGKEILSLREKEVLALVAEGFDNREIAEKLHMAEGTVRNYVSRIYELIGVHSRVEAVLWAIRHGI